MKRPEPEPSWPAEWVRSARVDDQEVFGRVTDVAYAHAYGLRQQFALQAVQRHVPLGARLLDVAAAQGNFTLLLAEAGYEVTWNDLRDELVGYVAAKHERGTVRYLPGNVFDLAPDEPFDAALMTEVIEHVAHPDEFLAAVARLVKPGGVIVMTTPNGEYWRNDLPRFSDCPDPSMYESQQFKPDADGHIFLLHADEVRGLAAEVGLEVLEHKYFTNTFSAGHVKTARLLRRLPESLTKAIERKTQGSAASRWRRALNAQTLCVLRVP